MAQLDAGPQGTELAPHFGRLPAGPGSAFGQAPLELLALGRQLGFGAAQAVAIGNELGGGGGDLGQFARHARRLRFEGRHQGVVDEGRPVALERPPALGQKERLAAGPLAQGFGPPHDLAEARRIRGGQRRFGAGDGTVELGQPPAELALL